MPKRRIKLGKRLLEAADLPAETAGEPRLTQVGRSNLLVENHRGVFEYRAGCVRLKTRDGMLLVTGGELIIRELSKERMLIAGRIDSVGFEG